MYIHSTYQGRTRPRTPKNPVVRCMEGLGNGVLDALPGIGMARAVRRQKLIDIVSHSTHPAFSEMRAQVQEIKGGMALANGGVMISQAVALGGIAVAAATAIAGMPGIATTAPSTSLYASGAAGLFGFGAEAIGDLSFDGSIAQFEKAAHEGIPRLGGYPG